MNNLLLRDINLPKIYTCKASSFRKKGDNFVTNKLETIIFFIK